jgi:hypothetical protein
MGKDGKLSRSEGLSFLQRQIALTLSLSTQRDRINKQKPSQSLCAAANSLYYTSATLAQAGRSEEAQRFCEHANEVQAMAEGNAAKEERRAEKERQREERFR